MAKIDHRANAAYAPSTAPLCTRDTPATLPVPVDRPDIPLATGAAGVPRQPSLTLQEPTPTARVGQGSPVRIDVRAQPGELFAGPDVLLLGDSQSVGTRDAVRRLARQRQPQDSHAAAIRSESVSGRTSQELLAHLRTRDGKAQIRKSRLVVVQMGGNDISGGRSAQTVRDNLRAIVRCIQRINPDARIVVADIPVRWRWFEERRSDSAVEHQRRLDSVNQWIQQGGDPELRFTPFAANAIVAECDNAAAGALGETCESLGPDYHNVQRPDFRRNYIDVHLNNAGYDAIAAAFRARFVMP